MSVASVGRGQYRATCGKRTEGQYFAVSTRNPPYRFRPGLAVSRPSAPGSVLEQDKFSWLHVYPGSAQRGLSDQKEYGTANHAKHAKGGGALQGQDDAFDLKARLAKVE